VTTRHCVRLNSTSPASYELSENKLTSAAAANQSGRCLVSVAPAGSVFGQGNESNRSWTITNALQLQPPRRKLGSNLTARANVAISADADVFVLADSGAVTVDRVGFGSGLMMPAFDGASITLIFSTGNTTLGAGSSPAAWAASTAYAVGDVRTNASRVYQCIAAGTSSSSGGPSTQLDDITDGSAHWAYLEEGSTIGNLSAAGGARAAGSACRLVYHAATGKWIEA
jgi:hypothetical protein